MFVKNVRRRLSLLENFVNSVKPGGEFSLVPMEIVHNIWSAILVKQMQDMHSVESEFYCTGFIQHFRISVCFVVQLECSPIFVSPERGDLSTNLGAHKIRKENYLDKVDEYNRVFFSANLANLVQSFLL